MNIRILILSVVTCLLAGCGGEPELSTLGAQPLKVTTFGGGSPVRERLILPPSREHELLTTWAGQHKKGWSSSYVTYAPRTLLEGTNFSLNIQAARAILNIGGRQYVHRVKESDFVFLSQ